MDSVLIGRYLPGNSPIHQLDSRTKLLASFYFIVIVFFANNWISYGILTVFTLTGIRLSNIKLNYFYRGVRPLVWVILLTVILQIMFSAGDTVYWHWGIFSITKLGLINGAYIFCRFVLIICMSTILTLTTAPLSLADAIESLLKPLKTLRVPVDDIALMLSIALRFVPTLLDEAQKIVNAQRARAVSFSEGGLIKRIKAIIPILIPLFVSAFSRADQLATAMEARGYQGSTGRSKYRILKFRPADAVAGLVMILLTVLIFWTRS